MTSRIKTASLFLSAALQSACGLTIGGTDEPPNDATTSGDVVDDSTTEPTTGVDNNDIFVHFTCFNQSNLQAYSTGAYLFPLMHTCVSLPEGEPWDSDENIDKILDACSATCAKAGGAPNNVCENEGWASVAPTYGEPLSTTCAPSLYGPEYGDEILWLDGVRSPKRQVSCDLNSDCGLMFNEDVAKKLQSTEYNSDDDSGAEQVGGLEFKVTAGTGSPLRLSGAFEYSIAACGSGACPFYLGRLDLEQTDWAWPINVDLGALGRIDKTVSKLRVQLGEPALGISLADGQVAFPAGSLLLRIDAELSGASNPLLGNGAETFWLRYPDAVVGRLVDGSLDLRLEIPATFGAVLVETVDVR